MCFLTRNFQSHQNSITWSLIFTHPLRILLKPRTFSFKKDTITAKTVSKIKCLEEHKVDIYLANQGSGLAFFSTDLGHIFGSNVHNEFGVMLRGKGPHKPKIAYDIVRINSLMIYTDLIEYNVVGDTKRLMLQRFLFFRSSSLETLVCKLKLTTTGQYMNYQTFSNLQFRTLFKNFFHSIHIDLRVKSGEKKPFVSVGITRLALMFRKASNIHF